MKRLPQCVLLLSLCVSAAVIPIGRAANPAPPATHPATLTQHEQIAGELAFNRRTLGGAYDKEAAPKGDTEKSAREFLDRFAVYLTNSKYDPIYQIAGDTTPAALSPLVNKLSQCNSPIVQYCRSVLLVATDGNANAMTLQKYVPLLIAGDYPALRKYQAARALARLNPADATLMRQMNGLIAPAITEAHDPAARRVVFREFARDFYYDALLASMPGLTAAERQAALDIAAKSPGVDPWLLGLLRGEHEIRTAWELRGTTPANKVTPAGWIGFRQHIALARTALTAAYRADPTLPEAAAGMLTVCMAESNNVEARTWFDRAIAAQIDHAEAWSNYAYALTPQWGGSVEAMQRLADEALKTARFDTCTPRFAKTIFESMRDTAGLGEAAFRRPGVWQAMNGMIDGYTTPPRHGIDARLWRSSRAMWARACGRYAEAVRIIDALGTDIDPAAFGNSRFAADDVRTECVARSGPRGAVYDKLADQEASGDFVAAHDGYVAMLKNVPAGAPDRTYALRRERATAVATDFAAGRTTSVPTTIADDLAAWAGDTKFWTIDDGALTCTIDAKTIAFIRHSAVMPKDYRVTLQWQWEAIDKAAKPPQFEIAFRETKTDGVVEVDFRPDQNRVLIELGGKFAIAHRDGGNETPFDLSPDKWHAVSMTRTGSAVTLTLDGVKVFDGIKDDWIDQGEPILGFVVKPTGSAGTVRVREISVTPMKP